MFHRQVDATDQQIDALVYELYGLTVEDRGGGRIDAEMTAHRITDAGQR